VAIVAPDRLEGLAVDAVRIVLGAEHEGNARRRQEEDARDPALAVAGEVAHGLAAREGMGDERDVDEVERVEDGGEVAGERVVIVAAAGVARPAMGAAVIGDAAEALP